ncbi:hypothetical protein BASA60_008162 [Batrachochytrium salamandrivorans]|nr:hypothetical protein BASA60_008162 [Batrachochytrium salamandrivorans]
MVCEIACTAYKKQCNLNTVRTVGYHPNPDINPKQALVLKLMTALNLRTLVVAAMAITSVNAAGSGGLLGCFGRICRSRPNQKFEPKTDLICDPIVYEFRALWITIYDFDYKFSQEMTEFHNLIAGKKDDLKIEKLREWIGIEP